MKPWIIEQAEPTPTQQRLLRSLSFMLATPCGGGVKTSGTAVATEELLLRCQKYNVRADTKYIYNESHINRGRMMLAHVFMQTNLQYMMFIDSDIIFNPNSVLELLLAAQLNNIKVIGGNYPLKRMNWESIHKAALNGVPAENLAHCNGSYVTHFIDEKLKDFSLIDPLEVRHLGTGFMLIHRDAFLSWQQSFEDRWFYNNMAGGMIPMNEKVWAYFHSDIGTNELRHYETEDYYFCDTARVAGHKIYWAPWIELKHMGTHIFEGCFCCSQGTYIHEIRNKK